MVHIHTCVSYNTRRDNWIDAGGLAEQPICSAPISVYRVACASLHRLYRAYQNIEGHPDKWDKVHVVEKIEERKNQTTFFSGVWMYWRIFAGANTQKGPSGAECANAIVGGKRGDQSSTHTRLYTASVV